MVYRISSYDFPTRILFGFIAGFIATLTFHQLSVWVLWIMGLAPAVPYSMAVTKPFGVPSAISFAVWGGVWGIVFALIEQRFPANGGYWLTAFLFGAVLPSLVALLIVLPLKGRHLGGGWDPHLLLTAFIANGAWGVGVGLIIAALSAWVGRRRNISV